MDNSKKFAITTVAPSNYEHFRAFDEISEALFYALKNLQYDVVKAKNTILTDRINIVLGGQLLELEDLSNLPQNSIIFNFEQFSDDNPWMSDIYKIALEKFQVWDYSERNLNYLKRLKLSFDPIHVPVAFCKELEKINIYREQDIDVLFYGSINLRRKIILDRLLERKIKVKHLFNVYGEERDKYISRSKLVLNLSYYNTHIFEIPRVSYLLNNKIAVVSEWHDDIDIYSHLKDQICLVDYDKIPETCMNLVEDETARESLRETGYEAFSKLTQEEVIQAALQKQMEHEVTISAQNLYTSSNLKTGNAKSGINGNDRKVVKKTYDISVIAVAHQRLGELRVFVQSWINQTANNWTLHVIHDGENDDFCSIMEGFRLDYPTKISYRCTKQRFDDYGHSLREIGLRDASGDYVLITNADNYYIPKTVEFINDALIMRNEEKPDVIMFDMVHSHENPGNRTAPSYSYFQVSYRLNEIDMGAAIVDRKLAQKAGFINKTYAADAIYFENVKNEKDKINQQFQIIKIPRVLFVHN